MRYSGYLMLEQKQQGRDLAGRFKIVEADSAADAKDKIAKELALEGKLPIGWTTENIKRHLVVEKYSGRLEL